MATLAQIKNKIKDKFDTLTGTGKPLAFVYDHYTTNVQGFPCVMFEPDNTRSELLDTSCNLRTHTFMAYLMQDLTTITRDQAVDRIIDIFDQINNLFDNNYTLDGLCVKVETLGGDRDQVETESGFVILCRVPITCITTYYTGA